MSLFDDNLVERTMRVRHSHNIVVTGFTPMLFYKWIWNERGLRHHGYYHGYQDTNISIGTLEEIFTTMLGDIPGDVFEGWISELKDHQYCKPMRKYFKKLIKREYFTHGFSYRITNGIVEVSIMYEGIWGLDNGMKIIFYRK